MEERKYIKLLFRHNAFEEESIESAWAKLAGENFILDNILFYAKEYSWGDIIKAKQIKGEYFAKELVKESGHSTVRILFNDQDLVEPARSEIDQLGCSSELSNFTRLISIDIPRSVSYKILLKYFQVGENLKKWEYQEACISSKHQSELEEE